MDFEAHLGMINNQGRPAEESVQVQKWPGAGRREEEERMEGREEGKG